VILRLRSGQLSSDTQRSIASLVSGAVDKLSPQNVTITDADTNHPLFAQARIGVRCRVGGATFPAPDSVTLEPSWERSAYAPA